MSLFVIPDLYFQIIIIMHGILIAGLGYGVALKVKHLGRKIVRNWKYQSIFVLALSTLFIFLAQSLFSVHMFVVNESLLDFGWFAFISMTAIAMILLLGYRTIIINSKLKRFQNEAILVIFIILIIFNTTTFYWLIPNYYSGI